MEVGNIVAFGLLGSLLSVLLKKNIPQISILMAWLTGIFILISVCTPLQQLLSQLQEMAVQAGVKNTYFEIVLKVIGIAYLSQLGAQMCQDTGESAIAAKIELAGKILILSVSAPILSELMQTILSFV